MTEPVLPLPVSTPPSSPRSVRRWVVVAVVVVVVSAGLVGVVVLSGGGSASAPPSFSEARALANVSVATVSGGGWSLLLGVGVDQPGTEAVSVAEATNATGNACTASALPGFSVPTSVTIPGYSGSLGSGRAPLWLFVFYQSSSGTYALVSVAGDSATPLAKLTGASCLASLGRIDAIPSPFVDSTGADTTAWTNATSSAASFVAGDPAIDSVVMVALGTTHGSVLTYPAGWILEYAPCGPFASGPTTNETTYVVAVSAGGSVVTAATSSIACPVASG
jgi:hypothetical protein